MFYICKKYPIPVENALYRCEIMFFLPAEMPFACIENATVGTVRTFRLLTVGQLYIVYQQQDINNLLRVGLVFFSRPTLHFKNKDNIFLP